MSTNMHSSMNMNMKVPRIVYRSLPLVLLPLWMATFGGCAATPSLEERVAEVDAKTDWTAEGSRSTRKPVYAHRINDYLIYPVQWGTAEDMAATLEPVLQSRYGTGARVIPHVPTNKIFIYIPPPGERDQGPTRAPGTGGRVGGTSTRGASRVNRGPTSRGATTRSTGTSRTR